MANVGPNVWFTRDNSNSNSAGGGSVGWSAVAQWAASTSCTAGQIVRQVNSPTAGNERVFICTTAGTSGGSQPTWVLTKGALTTDNTVTWQECTGQPAVNGDLTDTPTWAQQHASSTTISIGLIITDAAQDFYFINASGTTIGATEPSWVKTVGSTTTDNTVTWTCVGAVGAFSAWAAPFARLAQALASTWGTAGNTFLISSDHQESQTSSLTVTAPASGGLMNNVISISPTSATLTGAGATLSAGATLTTTGNTTITLNGEGYWYGLTGNAGSGAVANNVTLGTSGNFCKFDTCAFAKLGTSATLDAFTIGSGNVVELVNTTLRFGNTGDAIGVSISSAILWRNTPNAIQGSTIPASGLFYRNTPSGIQRIICEGVDLSAITASMFGANTTAYFAYFSGCKFNSSLAAFVPANSTNGGSIEVVSSGSSGVVYQQQRIRYQGSLIQELTAIRTGGASDGTTGISWNITTTANSGWANPFEGFAIAIRNTVTGTDRGVTVHGIINAAAVPNNNDIWIQVQYFGSESSPLASFASSTIATINTAPTGVTADSVSAWDSKAAARQNSTAYTTTSAPIVAADNPGRLFWCISNGTTASSEPAGFASAVDGGSVTDGTATFRAGCRFLLSITLSSTQPALVGDIYVIPKAAKPSTTWYIDPSVVLS